MQYTNTSSAYDFSLFESRKQQSKSAGGSVRETKPQPTAESIRKKRMTAAKKREQTRQRAMLGFLSFIMIISIASLIAVRISNTEVTDRLYSQQLSYDGLVEDYDAMMVDFERIMSDVAIEEYATRLGMQKREAVQTEWVTVPGGDIFEIAVDEETMSPIESWYENLLTYFG